MKKFCLITEGSKNKKSQRILESDSYEEIQDCLPNTGCYFLEKREGEKKVVTRIWKEKKS